MKKKSLKFLLIVLIFNTSYSQDNRTALIDPDIFKTIISIEQQINGKQNPIGTGFVIETERHHFVLVTAKHVVLSDNDKILDNIIFRINTTDNLSKNIDSDSLVQNVNSKKYIDNKGWFLSESSDIACRFFWFPNDIKMKCFPLSFFLDKSSVDVGANILILGFPMGLRDSENYFPIARKGMISRNDSTQFIADAFIFPGNSGGPAIYVPTRLECMQVGTKLIAIEKLIGVVVSYKPYVDIAYSSKTKRPRIAFEENSGLCTIIPIENVLTLLNRQDFIAIENKILD